MGVKKRGLTFGIVLILLFISLTVVLGVIPSGVPGARPPEPPVPGPKYHDNTLQADYYYALQFTGTDPGECNANDGVGSLASPIPPGFTQAEHDNFLATSYFGYCPWKNLPLAQRKGCYFLSCEYNSRAEPLPFDYAGWYIPPGANSIIYSGKGTARVIFFQDNDDEAEKWSFPKFFNRPAIQEMIAQPGSSYHPSYETDQEAMCFFNHYDLIPEDSYACIESEGEFRWYACNEQTLGKMIRAPVRYDENGNPNYPDEAGKAYFCERNPLGGVMWNHRFLKCTDPGINCEQDRDVCESAKDDGGNGFDHIETQNGGVCCGNNGNTDLGDIQSDTNGNRYLCVNVDEAIGTNEEAGAPRTVRDTLVKKDLCDHKSWCWLKDFDEAFQIQTIKKQNNPYDVVSNGKEWVECTEGATTLTKPIFSNPNLRESYEQRSNRFYCYQKNSGLEWAECGFYKSAGSDEGDPYTNVNNYEFANIDQAKRRLVGDSLFRLPYPEAFPEPFDFTGYDQLEFLVKITPKGDDSVKPPFNVQLTIYGPEDENRIPLEYYRNIVLGEASNGVFNKDNDGQWGVDKWVHVQVDIPSNLFGVHGIVIEGIPRELVNVEVKNVYLSKKGRLTPLCSGEKSIETNSWLSDIDHYDLSTPAISGGDLCTAIYGSEAWLRNTDQTDRMCCGDDKAEYSAFGQEKACWNSQVLEKDKTAGNVEATISYKSKIIPIVNDPISFDLNFLVEPLDEERETVDYILCGYSVGHENLDCDGQQDPEIQNNNDHARLIWNNLNPILTNSVSINFGTQPIGPNDAPVPIKGWLELYSFGTKVADVAVPIKELLGRAVIPLSVIDKIIFDSNVRYKEGLPFSDFGYSPFRFGMLPTGEQTIVIHDLMVTPGLLTVMTYDQIKKILDGTIANTLDYRFSVTSSDQNVDVSFSPGSDTVTLQDIRQNGPVWVVAKMKHSVPGEPELRDSFNVPFTYPCLSSECLYPLPGFPPYTIMNEHPELYDLYFVTGPRQEDERLIVGEQTFDVPADKTAMLKAKRVPQQVLFTENKFFGCQAPEYITTDEKISALGNQFDNQQYCSTKPTDSPTYFCSPREGDRINSWSTQAVPLYSYNPDERKVTEKQACDPLNPDEVCVDNVAVVPAAQRTEQKGAIPGKNLIQNPLFEGSTLSGWTWEDGKKVIKDNGITVDNGLITTARVVDWNAEILQPISIVSNPISIKPDQTYFFSVNGLTCHPQLILFPKQEGRREPELQNDEISQQHYLQFAGEYSFFQVKLEGLCSEPFLVYMSSPSPIGRNLRFKFNTLQGEGTEELNGLACCPSGSCWNGFTCVNNMATSTFQVENVDGTVEYRCIDGNWKSPTELKDWQDKSSGYCPQPSQCFVFGNNNPQVIGNQEFNTQGVVNAEYAAGITPEGAEPLNFAGATQQFYTDGTVPTCLNSGEYLLDNYCDNGEWSSRTKLLAGTLAEFAERQNDYVLYCSGYDETLVDQSQNNVVTGTVGAKQICFEGLHKGPTHPTGYLVSPKENLCVNNFCVLKYKDGRNERTAFGVSLNTGLESQESRTFMEQGLGIPSQSCPSDAPDQFVQCGNAKVWYHKKLNVVIFDKEGIALNGNVIDRIVEFVRNLFGLSDEEKTKLGGGIPIRDFINQPGPVRTLLVLQEGDKAIRGVKETRGASRSVEVSQPEKELLTLEYENFDTDLCQYIDNARSEAAGVRQQEGIVCTKENDIQKVKAIADTDFWWPKLTGSLRVGEEVPEE